jgi:excinuclease ABC subunit A
MIAFTGLSGSGKSSLVSDILFPSLANVLHHAEHHPGKCERILGIENIDKVIAIDQSPIGRNPRSNPATYIKIFDEIRNLFCKLPESAARGYQPGRFSFNVKSGSCSECHGLGMLKIDMDFMEAAWVPCTHCKSKRFDHETLSIYYKGKNIYEVLEMSVGEALEFFHAIPVLRRKLEVLDSVGMSYIKLGQSCTTLSGGEAQRIKLAKELSRPSTGRTFYILDEPTTGLHFHDIKALLHVLQELVDRGNTVLVIEHNTDVIKAADWIIELGPEGGAGGGELIAAGTPEFVAQKKTPTGIALKEALAPQTISTQSLKKKKNYEEIKSIIVEGAEQNNLKRVNLKIPRGKMTICTGPSGSGKSSLAFDTIYAEGQRRYIESLSPYARQFVHQMPKPKVLSVEGLSPSIAIEQKASSGNPRSTVGTMTEVYDYLRILFAHAATPYDPETGERIQSITKEYIVNRIMEQALDQKIVVLAPLHLEKNEKFEDLLNRYRRLGYLRLRLNGTIYEFDDPLPYDRKRKNEIALVIDRLKVSSLEELRLHEAIEKAVDEGNKRVIVMREKGDDLFFNIAFAVEKTGKSYPPITPHTFSFNHPEGSCPDCHGLGIQYGANLSKNEWMMSLNIFELLHFLWSVPIVEMLQLFLKEEKIDLKKPLSELPSAQLHTLLKGHPPEKWINVKGGFRFQWIGLETALARAAKISNSEIKDSFLPLLDEIVCSSCRGARINPLGRHARLEGHSIASFCALPVQQSYAFLEELKLEKKEEKLLEEVLKQIRSRLKFLIEVGLHYISLDRRAPTLSNGEAQRIRLARQLGNSLTGVLYVLDEPTIGLHPHDNAKLNAALNQLKSLGNTLLMVEHDPMTVEQADYLFDFGPGAGVHGGHIVAQGTLAEIKRNKNSPTGAFLSGKREIPLPKKRRVGKGTFLIEHAKANNLKDLNLEIPKGALTCLTGVSGSGKSTLMHDVIRPLAQAGLKKGEPFDKLIVIDQNPIGHTVRSDVGTYSDVLTTIRDFYAGLGLSRMKGLQPKNFSYNHRKGMCTHCSGLGYRKVEMLFLAPVRVTCDVCKGLRLNPVSLEVKYQGVNFGEILEMTVVEARQFFELLPKAKRILETLISTGLGYLKLGQEMATLSGGEAQRMKLSRELSKRGTGKTLYLMDEPTTGQHPLDIEKLLLLFQKLVDKGNTLVVIEHNLDIIKNADMIFDIGPDAGVDGGYLVAKGTPEQIVLNDKSYTGKYLKLVLEQDGTKKNRINRIG